MICIEDLLIKVENHLENTSEGSKSLNLFDIAEVMSSGTVQLTQENVTQYDMLLCRFAMDIEVAALSKLAFILAYQENGPPKMVEFLAQHEDILVAGSVLAGSPMLDDNLLVGIVQSRPQPHLHAVCERLSLSEVVTSMILEYGDETTTRHLARNSGASFSDHGYATLVSRSKDDNELAERVGGRNDIPARQLKLLLDSASDHVRERLIKSYPKIANTIQAVVTSATLDMTDIASDTAARLALAHEEVAELYRKGKLDSSALVGFARQRKTDETHIALALICRVDPGAAYRVIEEFGHDMVLMMARLCGLTWEEAKVVLLTLVERISPNKVDIAGVQFARINPQVARKVLNLRLRSSGKVATKKTLNG